MKKQGKRTTRSFSATTRTLLGGAIAVTSFIAAAGGTGLTGHIAKSLDASFQPLADGAVQTLAITGPEASNAIGANGLTIRGQTAWTMGNDLQARQAPDGFYRLSSDRILKVQDGKVSVNSDVLALAPIKWKDWYQKLSSNQPAAPDADVQATFKSLLS
jgi:hypothetical protein